VPQTCTVCRQPNVENIEHAIVSSQPLRDIAGQYGLSKTAVARHKDHLSKRLVKAKAAQEVVRADRLMDYMQQRRAVLDGLDEDAWEVQQEAKRKKDGHGVLEAIKTRTGIARAQQGYCDLWGRVTGEFDLPAPVHQNVLIQVISMPKIGEEMGPAVECQDQPAELPPGPGDGFTFG
jgi:hypothetical protein